MSFRLLLETSSRSLTSCCQHVVRIWQDATKMMYMHFLWNRISALGAVDTLREQRHSSIYTPSDFVLQEDSGKHISSIWLPEETVGTSVLCWEMVTLDISIARRIWCSGGQSAGSAVIHLSAWLNSCKHQLFQNERFTGCLLEFRSWFWNGYKNTYGCAKQVFWALWKF